MSSLTKIYASTKQTPVEFVRVNGPYYNDSLIGYTLFPFTYENGVLDLALIDNMAVFLNSPSPPLSTADSGQTNSSYLYKLLGGNGLVQSLGPNFLKYINGWQATNPQNSSVLIYSQGVVTKVQASPKNFLLSGKVFRSSATPPSGDGYIAGNDTNLYRTTWVFKQPLTIAVTSDGVTTYVTFSTTLY